MLTSATTGPTGERSGLHQYSPGLSGPVGFPVGVPCVWPAGFCIAAVGETSTAAAKMNVDHFARGMTCKVKDRTGGNVKRTRSVRAW